MRKTNKELWQEAVTEHAKERKVSSEFANASLSFMQELGHWFETYFAKYKTNDTKDSRDE